MSIKMNYNQYNDLMDFAKRFVAKPGRFRPILEHIRLTVKGKVAEAEAIDGFRAGAIVIPLIASDGDGVMQLPVTPKLKKQDNFAIITDDENEVKIGTATGARMYRKIKGDFPDVSKVYPTDSPENSIAFNPVLLAEALMAFSGEQHVVVEYHGEFNPLVIKGKSGATKALVLPVRR